MCGHSNILPSIGPALFQYDIQPYPVNDLYFGVNISLSHPHNVSASLLPQHQIVALYDNMVEVSNLTDSSLEQLEWNHQYHFLVIQNKKRVQIIRDCQFFVA